jgi:uncharacterized protein
MNTTSSPPPPDNSVSVRQDKRFWGFWPTLGFGFAFGAIYILVGLVIGIIFLISILVSQPNLALSDLTNRLNDFLGLLSSVSVIVTAIVSVALTWVFIRARHSISVYEYLGLNKIRWKTALVLILITAVFLVVSGLLSNIFNATDNKFDVQLFNTSVWPPLLWLALVIFAPISEEILFRGFLFQGFRYSRIGDYATILLTALVWSSLHIQYNIYGIANIFVFGLVLGFVRLKTDSLWSPLLMHGLWNLIATVQLALAVGSG